MADEDANPLGPAWINQTTRMSERVTVVEQKVIGLKEDTTVIRATLHEHANEMQKFVVQEERCASNLAALTSKVADLTTSVGGLATTVTTLTATRESWTGVWKGMTLIGAVIMPFFALIAWIVVNHVQINVR
jgi:hypothetical protein